MKKKQEDSNSYGKILLILDNAPSHVAADELNAVNKDIVVMYLPPNVTALIQPMDQGVIEAAKKIYKRSLARRLLLQDDKISLTQFLKKLSLKDCCEMIAAAWEEVKSSSLQKAWNNVIQLVEPSEHDTIEEDTNESLLNINIISNMRVSEAEFEDWLHEDETNQTSELLDDDHIVSLVRQKDNENHIEENFDSLVEADDENQTVEVKTEFISKTVHDVLTGIKTAYTWFETQPECTMNDLIVLNKVRNLAEKKAYRDFCLNKI